MKYVLSHKEFFSAFIADEDITEYTNRKIQDH